VRVLVAGASGVIGGPLIRRLVAAGHEVTGTTSAPARSGAIEAAGARAAVCDALDAAAVAETVAAARPEAVVNELTRLPREYKPRTFDYEATNRVRREGGRNLLEAARSAGARRFVTQSIAFLYAPEGPSVVEEDARPWTEAPGGLSDAIATLIAHERAAVEADGLDGLVLRYGQFYGPGTYFARDGSIARRVAKRRFPIVGPGEGVFSFIHTDDAAAATVAAVERGAAGLYHVTDDEPAPLREWLPVYADALGAKPPFRIPTFVGRILGGSIAAQTADGLRGASNAKAKRDLGWTPRYPSWRQGFREALQAPTNST
jgi:nucleoside-diphosphate-sugar epimerase